MGKVRSIHGGQPPVLTSTLMAREPHWEIRQIYTPDNTLVGDLIVLYAHTHVRAVVILRSTPDDSDWERLDSWVLAQIDNYERRFVVDYYEGKYVTGLEGPPERPEDEDYTE